MSVWDSREFANYKWNLLKWRKSIRNSSNDDEVKILLFRFLLDIIIII